MQKGKIIHLPDDGRKGYKIVVSTWPVPTDLTTGIKDRGKIIELYTELTTPAMQYHKSRVAAMKALKLPYILLQRHKLPFLYFRSTEMGTFIFKFERSTI